MLGELRATDASRVDDKTLRQRLAEDGYLYLQNTLNHDDVLAARAEVFGRLEAVGEIQKPAMEGRSTGTSQRGKLVKDLGAFWKSVSEGTALRKVTHAGPIRVMMDRILGGPSKPFDFLWLRAMHPGCASAYHYDHVYMNRGTDHLFTVWTPLGDVELDEAPLTMVEGSHCWDDLIEQYRGFNVEEDTSRPGHVTLDPVGLATERKTRLLTAAYRVGDVMIFPMFTLHGSLDNRSSAGRARLSCDARYQLASDSFDPRWIGANPVGHGKGYASMSGAQPATSDPLFR